MMPTQNLSPAVRPERSAAGAKSKGLLVSRGLDGPSTSALRAYTQCERDSLWSSSGDAA
jgi:hypothetical protein